MSEVKLPNGTPVFNIDGKLEFSYTAEQMEEYAEQRVREALAAERMRVYMEKTSEQFKRNMEICKDLNLGGVLYGPRRENN